MGSILRLWRDMRYGSRTLRKSPVFSAVAVLTLALGIGANSSIFTLLDAVLLRPLPFPDPGRLVLVWEETNMFGLKDSPAALGNYSAWRARNQVFEEMGAQEDRLYRLTGAGEPQQVMGSLATAGLFRTLAVPPALGRWFRDDEDRPGAAKVVLLSDGLWRSRFGADAAVVGRTALINDEKYTIVGVMPPGFRFPRPENDLWTPLGSFYPAEAFENRGRHNFMVVARLRPGVSLERANENMRAIAAALERETPESNEKVGAFVAPLRTHFVSGSRTELLVLGGAVGFVLLIACANVANLLLSRAARRKREIAIRTALGASRRQVLRQLLVENLMLSLAGGACGLLVAMGSVLFLQKLVPPGIHAMEVVGVNHRVLLFTAGVSVLTGLLFGLVPAMQTMKLDVQRTLRQGGAREGTGLGARRLERSLVVSEVALAFVLTLGAALLIQTMARLRGVNPGFRADHLLTLNTALSRFQYAEPAKRLAFYDAVLRRVTALPGVVSAGFANHVPIWFKGDVNGFQVEGRPAPTAGALSNANYRVVTPDYLRALGIPLREGRHLEPHDTASSPPVLLINEAMKRKFWPAEDAIGKRIRISTDWISVVGVVGDIKPALDAPAKAEMYLPVAQESAWTTVLAVRTGGDPGRMAAAVRREIRAVDPQQPVTQVRTMDEILDLEVVPRRLRTVLLTIFASLALLLAALGIYGVLAYSVAQRTREIGIRIALGALPGDVLRTVVGQGMGLSGLGIVIGLAGGLALTRVLEKLLFGVAASDPATLAAAAGLLLAVAWLASYLPARQAMRLDPIVALREE